MGKYMTKQNNVQIAITPIDVILSRFYCELLFLKGKIDGFQQKNSWYVVFNRKKMLNFAPLFLWSG